MRLLIDQGFGRTCAELLRQRAHDAVHVAEIGRHADSDPELLRLAIQERRVVVTLDADFHALVAISRLRVPSVVRVRIQGLKSEPAAEIIAAELARSADVIERGALVTIYEGRTGVHLLPVEG